MNAKRARIRHGQELPKTRGDLDEQPVAEAALREVQAILDEELNRLPETQRAAFVLCCLEGKTKAEVARELGWKEGTVASRLARTRKQLEVRLRRRGVLLAAALCAIEVSRAAAAVSPALRAATVRAGLAFAGGQTGAAKVASSGAAVLAQGLLRGAITMKSKLAITLLLIAALTAGVSAVARQALLAKSAGTEPAQAPAKQPAPHQETNATVEIHGQVLDPSGKPVPGARLYVPRKLTKKTEGEPGVAMTPCGTTRMDGHFALALAPNDLRPTRGMPVPLVATAEGFGLDWIDLSQAAQAEDLTIHLVQDMPIHVRLINTEGKPLSGVTVTVVGINIPRNLDDFLQTWQRDKRAAQAKVAKSLHEPLNGALAIQASDKEGRLEIRGVGADRFVVLDVETPAFAQSIFLVITRAGLDLKALNESAAKDLRDDSRGTVLFGPAVEHVLEPSALIAGSVREAGSHKPVAGARVEVTNASALTDASGRFQLRGFAKRPQYTLLAKPPEGAPLLERYMRLAETPKPFHPLQCDIELPRGVVISGRVVDKASGKGVPGAYLMFHPLPDNKYVHQLPNDAGCTAHSGRDGRYRLVAIPGSGMLVAQATESRRRVNGVWVDPYRMAELSAEDRQRVHLETGFDGLLAVQLARGAFTPLAFYNVARVIDVAENGNVDPFDLFLDPGKTQEVHVEDPEGKPLIGAIAAGIASMSAEGMLLEDPTCPVFALDPNKPRQLVLVHPRRRLAGVFTVRGDEPKPLTVRLQPTGVVTGRLLDPTGQPIAGAQVVPMYAGSAGKDLRKQLYRQIATPLTDADGRFLLETIVPGLEFQLGIAKSRQRLTLASDHKALTLRPGETKQLGDVRTKPEE